MRQAQEFFLTADEVCQRVDGLTKYVFWATAAAKKIPFQVTPDGRQLYRITEFTLLDLSLEVARQQFAEMPKETQSRDTF
jgi:hypothetical protein